MTGSSAEYLLTSNLHIADRAARKRPQLGEAQSVMRRFKPPWSAERIAGGYVVKDATGQALAYVYALETKAQAETAKVLTMDEARRSLRIAKLPTLLRKED